MNARIAHRFIVLLFVIAIPLSFVACSSNVAESDDTGRIIINNEAAIGNRMRYLDDDIALSKPDAESQTSAKTAASEISLKLLAEVEPPVLDGFTLHANHVTFNNGHAFVSYSTKNDEFRGGVEIYDLQDVSHPWLKSQALFKDTDISIAVESENSLYLGAATDSDHSGAFATPACIEILTLGQYRITATAKRIDLPSYNANDIQFCDNAIFITTGSSDGGLSILAESGMAVLKQIEIDGAKAIDKSSLYIAVLEGTGTNLHLFSRSNWDFVKTISIGCDNYFRSKAEMTIQKNKVYLSAATCGTIVVDLLDGSVSEAIPAPMGGETFGVSAAEKLLFTANGKNGLQVIDISPPQPAVLGNVLFEGSTNYVATNGKHLFVAHGSGGFSILEIVEVRDIILPANSVVRADQGAEGRIDLDAAVADISHEGIYEITAEVWYNSGDNQKNESYYLEIRNGSDVIFPEDPNGKDRKIVVDDKGKPHTAYRTSGRFHLKTGKNHIDVYHYDHISDVVPGFLDGPVNGAESVKIRGFRLHYLGN